MSAVGKVELPVVGELGGVAPAAAQSESPLAQALHRLRRSKTALFGGAIAAALVVVAISPDVLAPQSPTASDRGTRSSRPAAPTRSAPTSSAETCSRA